MGGCAEETRPDLPRKRRNALEQGRTALFGGTFNPPHLGHHDIVRKLAALPHIGRILIMPVNLPPHKPAEVAPAEDRLAMCRLTFSDLPKVCLREDEIDAQGKSYTFFTLERLAAEGIRNPLLVIGADSLVTFDRWFCYRDILSMAELMVYRRDGVDDRELAQKAETLRRQGGSICLTDFCPPAVSSTAIRARVKNGQPIDRLVSESVAAYIKQKNLYAEE